MLHNYMSFIMLLQTWIDLFNFRKDGRQKPKKSIHSSNNMIRAWALSLITRLRQELVVYVWMTFTSWNIKYTMSHIKYIRSLSSGTYIQQSASYATRVLTIYTHNAWYIITDLTHVILCFIVIFGNWVISAENN